MFPREVKSSEVHLDHLGIFCRPEPPRNAKNLNHLGIRESPFEEKKSRCIMQVYIFVQIPNRQLWLHREHMSIFLSCGEIFFIFQKKWKIHSFVLVLYWSETTKKAIKYAYVSQFGDNIFYFSCKIHSFAGLVLIWNLD